MEKSNLVFGSEVNILNTLAYAGYIIALIGGILMLVSGVIGFFLTPFLTLFSPLPFLGSWLGSIFHIIIGIIAVAGSKYVYRLDWGITLLVLGAITGGAGGLVFLGAILGLISRIYGPKPNPA
jgi:hypothetical protein